MQKIINFSQIVISVFLIALILMQNKSGGLGSVFGGGDGDVFHTKRGPEKWLFYATIVLTILFIALGIFNIFINRTAV